jgi:hypothetical protein
MRFTQGEAQFTLAGISSEKTKFYYVILQLDHWYAAKVEDIITSPLEQDNYTMLKMSKSSDCCGNLRSHLKVYWNILPAFLSISLPKHISPILVCPTVTSKIPNFLTLSEMHNNDVPHYVI